MQGPTIKGTGARSEPVSILVRSPFDFPSPSYRPLSGQDLPGQDLQRGSK